MRKNPGLGKNLPLILGIIIMTALPFWLAPKSDEAFQGADNRAQQAIQTLAPQYQPWFTPVLEPASNEIASLLFALQAAIGAGVIGYWLGVSVTRQKMKKDVRVAD